MVKTRVLERKKKERGEPNLMFFEKRKAWDQLKACREGGFI